jgi:hypothetical protein
VGQIQNSVLYRILHLLCDETSGSPRGYALEARKLLWPLAYSRHGHSFANYYISTQWLKFSFRLLLDPSTDGLGDQIRFPDVAAALRLSFQFVALTKEHDIWSFLYLSGSEQSRPYWGGAPYWHTQAQFDLLVDYLERVCQGTDYTTIGDTFAALAGLRGSPNTLERKRLYIQTMIRFMGSEIPLRARYAAMSAAFEFRTEIASMGQDDETLRDLFSQALISVVRADDPAMQQRASIPVDDNPFKELTIFNWRRYRCYLGLLCALSKEPIWHSQLDRNGHFESGIAFAESLSSRLHTDGDNAFLAVHVTHLFAIVDALGENHQFLETVQTYLIWPLVLRAWRKIFSYPFFSNTTASNWDEVSSWSIVESLPSVAAYAKRYWERWDNREETHRLIQLVEQVSDKLDEEKRWEERSLTPVEVGQEPDTFGHRGIPNLSKEIWKFLDVL